MDDPFQIRFAIICEDSRREDNGKLIFIGVYGHNIIVRTLPAQFQLCLVTWLDAPEVLSGEMSLRVRLDSDVLAEGVVLVEIAKGRSISAFPRTPIAVDREGQLIFEMKFKSDWRLAAEIPIIHRAASIASNAPQPRV